MDDLESLVSGRGEPSRLSGSLISAFTLVVDERRFDAAGTYSYVCLYHAWMTGAIVVSGS